MPFLNETLVRFCALVTSFLAKNSRVRANRVGAIDDIYISELRFLTRTTQHCFSIGMDLRVYVHRSFEMVVETAFFKPGSENSGEIRERPNFIVFVFHRTVPVLCVLSDLLLLTAGNDSNKDKNMNILSFCSKKVCVINIFQSERNCVIIAYPIGNLLKIGHVTFPITCVAMLLLVFCKSVQCKDERVVASHRTHILAQGLTKKSAL